MSQADSENRTVVEIVIGIWLIFGACGLAAMLTRGRFDGRIMMRTAILLASIVSPLADAQESVFELKTWPGEGRPVLIAKHSRLALYSLRDLRSASVSVPYQAGWKIPFGNSVLRTLRAVEAHTVTGGAIDVWCDGSGMQRLDLAAGEPWTYLQYAAEGSVTARIQNRICQLPVYAEEAIFGRDLPQPDVQWWVQVLYADGSSPGWLIVIDEQLTYGSREF